MEKKTYLRTGNKCIDFSNPPVGKYYCPMPISREQIVEWELDPNLVVWHKFSGTMKLCYMVLTDETVAKEYIQSEKTECKRKERERRCIISSPITGKPICCPDTKSCSGCEYVALDNVPRVETVSYEALLDDDGFEKGTHDLTSDEVTTKIATEQLLTELRSVNEKLAKILELRLSGLDIKEIGTQLGIKKPLFTMT